MARPGLSQLPAIPLSRLVIKLTGREEGTSRALCDRVLQCTRPRPLASLAWGPSARLAEDPWPSARGGGPVGLVAQALFGKNRTRRAAPDERSTQPCRCTLWNKALVGLTHVGHARTLIHMSEERPIVTRCVRGSQRSTTPLISSGDTTLLRRTPGSGAHTRPQPVLAAAVGPCGLHRHHLADVCAARWTLKTVKRQCSSFAKARVSYHRSISLHGELDAAQTARLLEVSEKTPVTLTLMGGISIKTTLQQPGDA